MSDFDRRVPLSSSQTPASPSHFPGEDAAADEEGAGWEPVSRWTTVIWILGGAVVFLGALIVVVAVARQLRPVVAARLGTGEEGSRQRWIHQLQDGPGKDDRKDAAAALVVMGPAAVMAALDAVTEFSAKTNQAKFAKPVLQALAETGPNTVDILVEALRSDKENVRVAAVAILREMGPSAAGAVLPLAHLVQDHNLLVRRYACGALGNLGPAAEGAIEFLLDAAKHNDPSTRRWAIAALGRIGPAAKMAVAALSDARANDSDPDVRDAAAVALHQINLEAIVADNLTHAGAELHDLMRTLQEGDEYAAVAAAKTLAQKGSAAQAAIPVLALALRHKNKWVREASATALGAIGSAAKVVAPALQAATKDKEPEVRDAAGKALVAIGSLAG